MNSRYRFIFHQPNCLAQMLEEDVQSDDDDDAPEMDLLAEMDKLGVFEGDENDNVDDGSVVAISKASSKLFTRSNPVFDFKTRSSKVIYFLICMFRAHYKENAFFIFLVQ